MSSLDTIKTFSSSMLVSLFVYFFDQNAMTPEILNTIPSNLERIGIYGLFFFAIVAMSKAKFRVPVPKLR